MHMPSLVQIHQHGEAYKEHILHPCFKSDISQKHFFFSFFFVTINYSAETSLNQSSIVYIFSFTYWLPDSSCVPNLVVTYYCQRQKCSISSCVVFVDWCFKTESVVFRLESFYLIKVRKICL